MEQILLIVQLIVTIALVATILLQRSEGGGLGMGGGGGGGGGGLMSGRGTANLLTRTTSILAACFMGICLVLAILASQKKEAASPLDATAPAAVETPAPEAETPSVPSVPTPE